MVLLQTVSNWLDWLFSVPWVDLALPNALAVMVVGLVSIWCGTMFRQELTVAWGLSVYTIGLMWLCVGLFVPANQSTEVIIFKSIVFTIFLFVPGFMMSTPHNDDWNPLGPNY